MHASPLPPSLSGAEALADAIRELAAATRAQTEVHRPVGEFFHRATTTWEATCSALGRHRMKLAAAFVAALSPASAQLMKTILDVLTTYAHVKTAGG